MQCFMCGAEVGDSNVCYNCGADILLYKQIVYTSYVFYNQGLEKAKVRDLSGAIEALKSSLQYYKYNTRARNLLGLCYYQTGEMVRALNEWVISKNLQEDNPDADRYLAEIESTPGLLPKVNSTIKKYNQAIEYCKSGSRDLAIIQLKKVISQNANFVKAHQLLALLYLEEGKFADARKLLNQAAKIDSNNTTTIKYIHEVKARLKDQNTGKRRKKNDTVSFVDGNDTVVMSEKSFRSMLDNSRSSLMNIILGLVIGMLICFFLVVPTVKDNAKDGNSNTILALNEALAESNSANESLQSDIEKLKTELSAYDDKQDVATSYDNLFAAQNYYNSGDSATASQYIQLVTKEVLGEQGQQAYDTLYTALSPAIIQGFFDDGNNFYSEENYESAITNFKTVVDIDENYGNGAALFLLGDCYRLTDQTDLALECFEKVVELYPSNKWGKQAKVYIAADDTKLDAKEVGE
ncbi:Tetratricopeptide repeat-containing protein [Pseudobutyrivibrio sp. OR37]|uniref:tetratricopeptide repeat protein n=1 Tax=Pseudobutyrivibrio sp. OR37 TaxID=1798186 RepID=UPI0008E212DB|nr:tetratricopeptide repeat protein [Pseudobutyrivibrio sp. OR37]SFH79578.1 Tetratricopeptide repeat-containing protein [Pseudobutyrivibrio sp. OR37]